MKIAFYKGTGWISKSILHVSRGGYSHAAVQLADGSIIEAHARRGVCTRKSLLDQVDTETQVVVFDVETTPEQDVIITDFLKSQIGKGYDYWNIVGFVTHATKEGRKGYDRWFCSELVFAAFQKAGINLLERVEAWKVSPTILSYSPLLKTGTRYQLKMRTMTQMAL
jgi:uncharacterized protein YycO